MTGPSGRLLALAERPDGTLFIVEHCAECDGYHQISIRARETCAALQEETRRLAAMYRDLHARAIGGAL